MTRLQETPKVQLLWFNYQNLQTKCGCASLINRDTFVKFTKNWYNLPSSHIILDMLGGLTCIKCSCWLPKCIQIGWVVKTQLECLTRVHQPAILDTVCISRVISFVSFVLCPGSLPQPPSFYFTQCCLSFSKIVYFGIDVALSLRLFFFFCNV